MSKIPHRLYLTEDQMPQKWFNLRSAMAEQPDPLLHPGTLRPLGVDDLSPSSVRSLPARSWMAPPPMWIFRNPFKTSIRCTALPR